ncbi:MAG: hypothetical protein ACLQIQ_08405 [Beijerinckiaceae bacterium]
MLFNIEQDFGERVIGYVVPDGYSGVPTIRVCNKGEELYTFAANEKREALVHAGRHETGQCGFSIDTSVLPDLRDLGDLELFDAETDILIYRRPRPHNIKKKLLRLETHLFPLWTLDNAIAPQFQYFAKGIESFGRETVTQLFLLNRVESVYLSGKILYKNYGYFIESGFQTLMMLQDPYEELAERLLVLSKIRQVGAAHLGMRESVALEPAMDFAEALPTQDEKGLRRALRQMPENVTALLANPLVRQLTTASPDEMPGGGAVAAGLDILANSALVGLRREPGKFLQGLAELVEIEADLLPHTPRFATVAPLAQLLKNSGEVDRILEKDIELYHYVEAAFNKSP